MTEYIIFTSEELSRMQAGEPVLLRMCDGRKYVCCSEEHYKTIMTDKINKLATIYYCKNKEE